MYLEIVTSARGAYFSQVMLNYFKEDSNKLPKLSRNISKLSALLS